MSSVVIACIGGFLGAGKTTAIERAVLELKRRQLRVGVITNDQGAELVDTKVMNRLGVPTEEIAGGCFCCRFDELVGKARQILDRWRPDILLAEAVGSCTDLSATVYQPLRKYYGQEYALAPLTILVEPARMREFSGDRQDGFPGTVRYLFEKQLGEADLVVLNKVDTADSAEREALTRSIKKLAGDAPVIPISALTGEGVAAWVDILLSKRAAGTRILNIDYDTYARAEAALGWLNATLEVTSAQEFLPEELAEDLIRNIQRSLNAQMAVAHLKVLVATDTETNRIALTERFGQPRWSRPSEFTAVRELSLTINARISADPEELSKVVTDSISQSAGAFSVTAQLRHLESFSPSPPVPRYRMGEQFA